MCPARAAPSPQSRACAICRCLRQRLLLREYPQSYSRLGRGCPLDSVVNSLLIFARICYPSRNGGRLCKPHIIVTTYLTGFGNFWNRICLDAKALVARPPVTIGAFSMLFSGYFALVRRGEICRLTMGIGKIRIVAFAVGETRMFGKDYLKSLSRNRILSGL